MSRANHSIDRESLHSTPKGPKIRDILAAGQDPAQVLCQLTNAIHPIFNANNICVCGYKDLRCCVQPHFANLARSVPGTAKAPSIASPHPDDNIIVRASMQLASRILTHDDTLPFWEGILNCRDPKDGKISEVFEAHSSSHLSAERKAEILDHLRNFANRVRFHYEANAGNRTLDLGVKRGDPDWNGAVAGAYFAYSNGRPVVETAYPPFANIILDTSDMDGYDQAAKSWNKLRISKLKREIINGARLLCHEVAHALMTYTIAFAEEPALKGELMVETGFALENFLFGGVLRRGNHGIRLLSWPNEAIWDEYSASGTTIPLRGPKSKCSPAPECLLSPDTYECFLTDEFWEEPEVREGRSKKMWLRPPGRWFLSRFG